MDHRVKPGGDDSELFCEVGTQLKSLNRTAMQKRKPSISWAVYFMELWIPGLRCASPGMTLFRKTGGLSIIQGPWTLNQRSICPTSRTAPRSALVANAA
jgi:hypothetical protein